MMLKLMSMSMVAACLVSTPALAAPTPEDPAQQTPWDLYVDAAETAKMKQDLGDRMLLVDVRDPVEIMFTGFTDVVDVNVPFKTVDRARWNPDKPVYQLQTNPGFESQIAAALEARGLTRKDPVVLMCRSGGTRGAPATKLLEGKGYEQVYVVTDGFEGDTLKDGERRNWRLKNGWKNAGLPWSYSLDREKMYFPGPAATGKGEGKAAFLPMIQHATPMPNYMMTIKQHGEALQLNADQKQRLNAWVEANNRTATETVKRILALESEITTGSLDGLDKDSLMAKLDEVVELRRTLASGKADCRDHARAILTTEQWNRLAELEAARNQREYLRSGTQG